MHTTLHLQCSDVASTLGILVGANSITQNSVETFETSFNTRLFHFLFHSRPWFNIHTIASPKKVS